MMSDSSERLLQEVEAFFADAEPFTRERSVRIGRCSCEKCSALWAEYSKAVKELKVLQSSLKSERGALKRGYKELISCERDLQVQNVQVEQGSKERREQEELEVERRRKRQAVAAAEKKLKELDRFLDGVRRRGHGEAEGGSGVMGFVSKSKQAKKGTEGFVVFKNFRGGTFTGRGYRLKDPLMEDGHGGMYNLPFPNLYEVWFECERLREQHSGAVEAGAEVAGEVVENEPTMLKAWTRQPFDFSRSPLLWFRSYRLNDEFRSVHGLNRESSTFSNALNPHVPICRFSLAGGCRDDKCPFQHVEKFKLSPREVRKQLVSYSNDRGQAKRPDGASSASLSSSTVVAPFKMRLKLFQHFGKSSFEPSVVHTKRMPARRAPLTPKSSEDPGHKWEAKEEDYMSLGAAQSGESEDESDDLGSGDERYFVKNPVGSVEAVGELSANKASRVVCEAFFPATSDFLEHHFLPSSEWFAAQSSENLYSALNELASVLNAEPNEKTCVLYLKLYLSNLLYNGSAPSDDCKEAIAMLNNFISGLPTSVVLWSIYRTTCPLLFNPFAVAAPMVNSQLRGNLKYVYFNILGSCNLRCTNLVLSLHRKAIASFGALLPGSSPEEKQSTASTGNKEQQTRQAQKIVVFCRCFDTQGMEALNKCLNDKKVLVRSSDVVRSAWLEVGDRVVKMDVKAEAVVCAFSRDKPADMEEGEVETEVEEVEKRVIAEVLSIVDEMGGSCLLDDIESLLLDADLVCLRRQLPRKNAVDYCNAHAVLLTSSGLAKARMMCWRKQQGLRFDLMTSVSPIWRLLQPWCPSVFTMRRVKGKWVLGRASTQAGPAPKETALFESLFPPEVVDIKLIQEKTLGKSFHQVAYVDAVIQYAQVLLSAGYSSLLSAIDSLPKLRLAVACIFPCGSRGSLTDAYSIGMLTLCKAQVIAFNELPAQVVATFGVLDETRQLPVASWKIKRKGALQLSRLGEASAVIVEGIDKVVEDGGGGEVVEQLLLNLLGVEMEIGGVSRMKAVMERFQAVVVQRPNALLWRLFMRTSGDSDEAFALMASTCLKNHSKNPLLNWINVTDALIAQNDKVAKHLLLSFTSTLVAPEHNQKEALQSQVKTFLESGDIESKEDALYTFLLCLLALAVLENDFTTYHQVFQKLLKEPNRVSPGLWLCLLGTQPANKLTLAIKCRCIQEVEEEGGSVVAKWKTLRRVEQAIRSREYWEARCRLTGKASRTVLEPGLGLRFVLSSVNPTLSNRLGIRALRLYPAHSKQAQDLWALLISISVARGRLQSTQRHLLSSLLFFPIEAQRWTELVYLFILGNIYGPGAAETSRLLDQSCQKSGVLELAIFTALRKLL